MKRKVIQLAGKTLVVSLPSKWVKKYGVKKGEEVEVEEGESKLAITVVGKGEKKTKILDVKNLDVMLNRTIGGLYKAGYDEIEIIYHSPEQYQIIRDVLNKTCLGYEIIKQGQRVIVIRNLSDLHSQELDNLIRRLFLTLLSSAEDSLAYIKQNNLKGLEEIELRDQLINKYSDLCRRILNIQGYESTKTTTTFYYICEGLEKVGDGYRDLVKFILKNKINKIDKDTIEIISDLNLMLRLFYELFYEFNFPKLEEFGALSNKLKKEFANRLETSSLKELKLNYYLFTTYCMLFDMNGALITANV
ncbi:AbrB/MazE/SpoVT family DNA-binding domain-containing protein [Candidatus Woesearchaeota archaeon]|nr:AbrB/MazE/SpoVT family DNA-binding domain-containing protein [Candidatus Woesearchaeota archaeon]